MDRKLWDPLLRFESRDYIQEFYRKQHGRSLSAKRAHEIGACFIQGREYFSSAATASDAVKPLLIYYGISALGRGATLLKDGRRCEAQLPKGHGLTAVAWDETLAKGISEVLDLRIRCVRGTFSEFVCALGNSQGYTLLSDSGGRSYFKRDYGMPALLQGAFEFSLGDMLSRERELMWEYKIARPGGGSLDAGIVLSTQEGLRVEFMPLAGTDLEAAVAAYGFPASSKFSVRQKSREPMIRTLCVDIPVTSARRKEVAPMITEPQNGLGWLIRPLANGDVLIDIHRVYIISFILGMLCRYYPSTWISLLRSESGDICRTVILAAVAEVEAAFPRLLRAHLPHS